MQVSGNTNIVAPRPNIRRKRSPRHTAQPPLQLVRRIATGRKRNRIHAELALGKIQHHSIHQVIPQQRTIDLRSALDQQTDDLASTKLSEHSIKIEQPINIASRRRQPNHLDTASHQL